MEKTTEQKEKERKQRKKRKENRESSFNEIFGEPDFGEVLDIIHRNGSIRGVRVF